MLKTIASTELPTGNPEQEIFTQFPTEGFGLFIEHEAPTDAEEAVEVTIVVVGEVVWLIEAVVVNALVEVVDVVGEVVAIVLVTVVVVVEPVLNTTLASGVLAVLGE